MIFAAIDIGSNAVRLFISNVFENNHITISEKASLIRIPVRLGEDVFSTGSISEKKTKTLIKTLTAFKMLMEVYKPVKYRACATAAMREASNRNEVLAEIRNKTGIDVSLIDGMEEAKIVCASNNIKLSKKYHLSMYVDVGGGSTEISVLRDHRLIASNSFKIGTIRLLNNKTEASEWQAMQQWLTQFKVEYGKIYLIGSGGNINKLAKLYGDKNNNTLEYKALLEAHAHLSSYSLEERIDKLGMRPDRADVIIPAAKIFLSIMKNVKSDLVFVPKIGLPDGLIHLLYQEYLKEGKT